MKIHSLENCHLPVGVEQMNRQRRQLEKVGGYYHHIPNDMKCIRRHGMVLSNNIAPQIAISVRYKVFVSSECDLCSFIVSSNVFAIMLFWSALSALKTASHYNTYFG